MSQLRRRILRDFPWLVLSVTPSSAVMLARNGWTSLLGNRSQSMAWPRLKGGGEAHSGNFGEALMMGRSRSRSDSHQGKPF